MKHRSTVSYMYRTSAFLLALSLLSCVNHKQLVNFNEGPAFPVGEQAIQMAENMRIQPDDLLEIGVYSQDPEAVAPFTLQGAGSLAKEGNNISGSQFLVDNEGHISFPILGNVHLAGLSIEQARDTLKAKIEHFITNPIIHMRWLNFKFTVLGEVNKPATYTLQEQRISVLEAVGYAGDLTNYGNRKNILVIREQDGKRIFGRLNLQDRAVFNSPYYYLKQNDVVYIEPLKQKTGVVSDQATKALPWISAGAIVANIFILIFR